jgi:hypothetical protein
MDALAVTREEPGEGRALHNMSAPPTMRIAVRPLGTPIDPRKPGRRGPRLPGYRGLARVDLEALLRERFPGSGLRGPCQRLAALLLLARGAAPEDHARLARSRRETLEDGLREAAAQLDPRALGLPAFALVRAGAGGEGLPEPDPVTAIALLTRTAGAVFVAGRSPRVAGLEQAVPVQCYLVPVPPEPGVGS